MFDVKTILTAFGVYGLLFFVLLYFAYKLVDRKVDSALDLRQDQLKKLKDLKRAFLERRQSAAERLMHKIADSRNAIRLYEISSTHREAIAVLSKAQAIADALYECQTLMEREAFGAAHLYKRAAEKVALHLLPESPVWNSRPIPPDLLEEINKHYEASLVAVADECNAIRSSLGLI